MNSILFSLALLFAGVSLTLACNSAGIGTDCAPMLTKLASSSGDPCPALTTYWKCLQTHLVGCSVSIESYRAAISSYGCELPAGSSHVTVSAIAMIIPLLLAAWKGLN